MSESTVVITEILPRNNDKAPYAAKDGNGALWKSWKDIFGGQVGNQVVLTHETKSREFNGKTYTDEFVSEITAAPEPEEEPKLGTGEYVRGQTAPSDKRGIQAAVALKAAVDTLSHTIKTDATPKAASERVLPLAGAYLLWLMTTSSVEIGPDDDIPFGDA